MYSTIIAIILNNRGKDEIELKFPEDTFFEDFPVIGISYYLTNKIFLLQEFVYGARIRNENIDPSITQTLNNEQTKKDLENMKKLEIELMQKYNIIRSQKQLDFEEFIQKMKKEIKERNQEYKDLYKAIDQNILPNLSNQFL